MLALMRSKSALTTTRSCGGCVQASPPPLLYETPPRAGAAPAQEPMPAAWCELSLPERVSPPQLHRYKR
eukprot:6205261-Pleurochrysis_carterae.AAC.4